jgi:hypothetical protein
MAWPGLAKISTAPTVTSVININPGRLDINFSALIIAKAMAWWGPGFPGPL